MKTRNFAAGEYVYHEGSDSDGVYLVEEGEIEVLKTSQGQPVLLGVLYRGEIFGEVGVLREKTRGTTTRCRSNTKLLCIPKNDFLGAFGGGNELTLRVLRALCERLASAGEQLASRWTPGDAVQKGDYERIRLLPASEIVARQIGSEGVEVEKLPFRVGALQSGSGGPKATDDRLVLHTQEKYELSQSHFAINLEGERLVVADLGSQLGTVVNGVRVSGFEHVNTAGLQLGENLVVAGGLDSAYRFIVHVE